MYKFRRLPEEALYLKGKKLSAKSKDFTTHLAKWLIEQIQQGEDLTIYPSDAKGFPMLAEVLYTIDESPELCSAKDKAESVRNTMFREELLALTKEFQQNPSPENEKRVDKHYKTYMALSKKEKETDVFHLILENMFEDDYWNFGPLPENPRIDRRDVSYEEWIEHMGRKLARKREKEAQDVKKING